MEKPKLMESKVGTPFWVGTAVGAGIFWGVAVFLTDDMVLALFAAAIFCWLGGILVQAAADVFHAARFHLLTRSQCILLGGCMVFSSAVVFLAWKFGARFEYTSWIAIAGFLPLLYGLLMQWRLHSGETEVATPPPQPPPTRDEAKGRD